MRALSPHKCHVLVSASILSGYVRPFLLPEFSTPAEGTWLPGGTAQGCNELEVYVASELCPVPSSGSRRKKLSSLCAGHGPCQGGQAHWVVKGPSVDKLSPSLLRSVHLDGIFPQFEKLEKLVFGPLLQGHEGSSFLLQILVDGKNDLGPLLCLLVSGVPEEPLQGLLVYVFKDVAHGFLASSCVEVVAVDGRAYSKR